MIQTQKEFLVTIREDWGDQFKDESKTVFGTSELDVKTHMEILHGAETKERFYIVVEL